MDKDKKICQYCSNKKEQKCKITGDFVARKKGEYIYVQVCYMLHDQSTIEREFGNLEKISNNYPKMVVSMDTFAGNTRNGIQHMHILDFLTREL